MIRPARRNPNLGTLRGAYQIEQSFRQFGAGRGGVAASNGEMVAGNHALQTATDLDFTIREVHSDGSELIVLRRRDLTPEQARELSLADNRTQEVDYCLDEHLFAEDIARGVDIDPFWTKDEQLDILRGAKKKQDKETATKAPSDYSTIRLRVPLDLYQRFVRVLSRYPGGDMATQLGELLSD